MEKSLKKKVKLKALKHQMFWLGLGYFWLILTAYFCLSPNPPDTSSIEYGDKILHLMGYSGLMLWFAQIYQRQWHWQLVISLILFGIAIEFAQSVTGYRSFEVEDMMANASGVLIAWALSALFGSLLIVKLELFLSSKLSYLR